MFSIGRCSITAMAISSAAAGFGRGSIHSEADFEVGFHVVKRCWGKGFGTEAALGALEYEWEKLLLSKVYAGHHPENRASEKILKKLGFEFIENVYYMPTGLMHPSYVCMAPTPRPNTSTST